MPKYTGQHIEIIENLALALPNFAPAAAHSGADGYGYFLAFQNYMAENEEDVGGIDMGLTGVIAATSRTVQTGSGVRVAMPAFNGQVTRVLPNRVNRAGTLPSPTATAIRISTAASSSTPARSSSTA